MWRRVRHHVFTLACAVSLVAALCFVGLWWRSYGVIDAVVGSGGGRFDIKSWRGQVMVTVSLGQRLPNALGWRSMSAGDTHLGDKPLDAGYRLRGAGFAYQADTFGRGRRQWTEVAVAVPHWFLIAVLLAGPAMWCAGAVRRRRLVGCCQRCGYDLRASGDGCPECGWKGGESGKPKAESGMGGPVGRPLRGE